MSYLAKNYNRKKISFKFGKGSYLFSSDNKRYLDFVQGIAVNSLGHSHPKLVKTIKSENASPLNVSQNLCEHINKNYKYKKGVTNVFTKTDEVWESKAGVCQDFTNVLIELCRIAQIPCRYVSGYVFATGRFRGTSATHAWVEVFIPNYGWIGLDPTNNCIADIYHIKLAVGRNYNDCSPVKGVYKGNETQLMDVKVELDTNPIRSDLNYFEEESAIEKEKSANNINSYQKNLQMIQQQQ